MNLSRDGFEIVRNALTPDPVSELRSRLSTGQAAGRRGLANDPYVKALVDSIEVRSVLPSTELSLVRSILFDKSPEANWPVAWHRDRTITVAERKEVPNYGPWTRKEGTDYVEPPRSVLESMLTLRIHLDDTPAKNGALRVIPGSHRHGKLTGPDLDSQKSLPETTIACSTGDALLMRPLHLHSSPRAQSPRHRRILHLEFADPSRRSEKPTRKPC